MKAMKAVFFWTISLYLNTYIMTLKKLKLSLFSVLSVSIIDWSCSSMTSSQLKEVNSVGELIKDFLGSQGKIF